MYFRTFMYIIKYSYFQKMRVCFRTNFLLYQKNCSYMSQKSVDKGFSEIGRYKEKATIQSLVRQGNQNRRWENENTIM